MKTFKLDESYADSTFSINAYNADDERGRAPKKERFLTHGKALFLAATKSLASEGWKVIITVNRGGVAVSGEVYCKLSKPNHNGIKLILEGCSIRGNGMGRMSDGAAIIAQPEPGRGNVWLSADMDSVRLEEEIRRLLRLP